MSSEPMPGPQSPNHPLVGRQRHLIAALRLALLVAGVAAMAATVLDGRSAELAGQVFLGVLILVPLGRVAWLVVRWTRRRDHRFALTGAAMLVVAILAVLPGLL